MDVYVEADRGEVPEGEEEVEEGQEVDVMVECDATWPIPVLDAAPNVANDRWSMYHAPAVTATTVSAATVGSSILLCCCLAVFPLTFFHFSLSSDMTTFYLLFAESYMWKG